MCYPEAGPWRWFPGRPSERRRDDEDGIRAHFRLYLRYDVVAPSPVSLHELEMLKPAAGLTEEDERYLRLAGTVLADQTEELVACWRGILAAEPHLARYSLGPDGQPDPHYAGASGLRLQQWILDTCLRPYDQDWLDYQQEIALRHTSLKKNKTDGVESAPYVPLRYILAFSAVINETIKPFLAAKGHIGRRGRENASRLVCISAAADGAMERAVYQHNAGPR